MDIQQLKAKRNLRRKHRVRRAINGTATKPRLSVFRSNFQIYAQLIDDVAQVTLASACSLDKGAKIAKGGNIAAAVEVGKRLADKAKSLGITQAAFDRGSFRFHGRVKALARAATEAGLVCTGLEDVQRTKRGEKPATAAEAESKKAKAK